MLRIGDAARRYNVSNRTLRYWEEKGILISDRGANGYRYYDEENTLRIKQIVLLRKLRMPITQIEQIFVSNDLAVAIDVLKNHLKNMRMEVLLYDSLIVWTEKLVQNMESDRGLHQLFSYLESQSDSSLLEHSTALQIMLSERASVMPKNQWENVRIVKLPAMVVASYRAESATPEDDCAKVFNKFVLENNLHTRDGFRFFGFNNPSPTEGNPVYGYEMWVTIPANFSVAEPLVKKQFEGGLYASVSTHMNEIGERWQMLFNWCENSDQYNFDISLQWLEECTMNFQLFISEQVEGGKKQLDLLAPIQYK